MTAEELAEMCDDPLYFIQDENFRNELIKEVQLWEEENVDAEDYFDPIVWSQKKAQFVM